MFFGTSPPTSCDKSNVRGQTVLSETINHIDFQWVQTMGANNAAAFTWKLYLLKAEIR